MKGERSPSSCAVCGADLPANARACPECGADERTGWRESSVYDGLDLPDDDAPGSGGHSPRRSFPWVSLVATILLILTLLAMARYYR